MKPVKATTMFRKFTALIVLSVYVLFSVGIIKATHFCMGREASVQYFTAETKKCACSKYAAEKSSCCDDEHELIKIDDEQKVISSISLTIPVWKIERVFTGRLVTRLLDSGNLSLIDSVEKSPPKIPLWKAHRSYVFYDDEADSSAIA